MADVEYIGSTAILSRIRPGVLPKSPFKPNIEGPHTEKFKERVRPARANPQQIRGSSTHCALITRYLGKQNQSILLGEASHGILQAYIDAKNPSITPYLRKKWCQQAAEAIAYIHSRGVIHANMRPENFLVHESSPGCLDLLLCDFGGAKCDELDLGGDHLPDCPFYDPTQGNECSPALDIFSLGSLFYTILTGLWPYRSSGGPFSSVDEMLEYDAKVVKLSPKDNILVWPAWSGYRNYGLLVEEIQKRGRNSRSFG